jgi:hypothetical protein
VLPRRCTKVRHYGIFSPRHSQRIEVRDILDPTLSPSADPPVTDRSTPPRCTLCRIGILRPIQVLAPRRSRSP